MHPTPVPQGKAAEEGHTCIQSGSHGGTPTLKGLLALWQEGGDAPAEENLRAQGISNPQSDLT